MIDTLSESPLLTQSGVVEKGVAAARGTGFPTANIPFADSEISGTYAGLVKVDGKEYQAAIYANQPRGLLEAHLLDFSGDLYGKEITVILLQKIADGVSFRDSEDERTFIARVVAEVRACFNKEKE